MNSAKPCFAGYVCNTLKKKMSNAAKKKNPLSKKEIEDKKYIAYILYMAGKDQKDIAEQVGVTPKTISEWAKVGAWKQKRSAATITRDELINKVLSNVNKMLDNALAEDQDTNYASLADQLIKMTGAIEKLDRKNNVVYNIEAFTGFNKYLLQRMQEDKSVSSELVKQ